jgi:hypothetical protein
MHGNETFEDFVHGSTVDTCVDFDEAVALTFAGQDLFAKIDASVRAGRIKYNATDYEICRAAIEVEDCDEIFQQNGATPMLPDACSTYEVGQVPHGGACTLAGDCAVVPEQCNPSTHTCG